MLISKERRKRGRRRVSDRHGINICNRCAVGDCGPVDPVERAGSYWTHEFDHLAADGAGLILNLSMAARASGTLILLLFLLDIVISPFHHTKLRGSLGIASIV